MSKTNAGGPAVMSEAYALLHRGAYNSGAQRVLVSGRGNATEVALLMCLEACMHRVGSDDNVFCEAHAFC